MMVMDRNGISCIFRGPRDRYRLSFDANAIAAADGHVFSIPSNGHIVMSMVTHAVVAG